MNLENRPFTLSAAAYTFRVYPGTIDPVTYEVVA
jgi:hypothetical protein